MHSIEIKIADQVLNDFNNSICEIKKSRKVYKKQTLNSIMNKLHKLEGPSSPSQSKGNQSSTARQRPQTSHGNMDRSQLTFINKYSGGCDSLKRYKEFAKPV